MTGTIALLGLEFADLTLAQAASRIAGHSADAPFSYVVTPNADHLVRMSRDPRLRSIYRNNALCLLDFRVVFGLARLIGLAAPKVVPGSDLTACLLACHLRPGERITIVGLSPVWLPALVVRCGLAPPAHHNPPMGFDDDPAAFDAAVAFVRANPARFVFLAVGSPRQEYLPPRSPRGAARPGPDFVSVQAWNFSPAHTGGRLGSYAGWGWNGCSGWLATRAGCSDVI